MYVQESRIIVRIVEHPTNYPTMVFTMEMGDNSFGGEEILEELRNIAFLDGQLEFPEMHVVSGREGQTNWGHPDLSVNTSLKFPQISFRPQGRPGWPL